MKTLRSLDSGRICGPKAANLGQLKRLFPHRVVDGLVIPFGIFRKHLDQPMPGSDMSYWQFLHATFVRSKEARKSGQSEAQVEAAILESLAKLRESVRSIPLLPEFKQALIMSFNAEFGAPLGSLPVFIRSDTNMEDLKDFSGAGLNLTVFNVRQEAEIWQAIRDVWSSPYSERSYRWRQRLLLNPEQVYPSILLLPSVNVEKSGVMVTTGVVNGDPDDTMVAFNRGVGGAVEGQAAESYLLKKHGRIVLLSPSREMRYMTLPVGGGVQKQLTRLHQPVLNLMELKTLQKLATEIRDTLPGIPGIETSGPFDVELGFKDGAVRLFQVRPYIENRRARSSEYLMSLDPTPPASLQVSLTDRIELNQRAHSP